MVAAQRRQLLAGCRGEKFDHCQVFQEFLWQTMKLGDLGRAIVRTPDFALGVFPHQNCGGNAY